MEEEGDKGDGRRRGWCSEYYFKEEEERSEEGDKEEEVELKEVEVMTMLEVE